MMKILLSALCVLLLARLSLAQCTPTTPITWDTNQAANVTITNNGQANNNMQKSLNTGVWDAGAPSTFSVASGDTAVQLTVDPKFINVIVGFRVGAYAGPDYAQVTWAIDTGTYLGVNSMYIFESGTLRAQINGLVAGDVLKLSVENGQVKYYRNGTSQYTSVVSPSYPMRVDASMAGYQQNLASVLVCGASGPTATPTPSPTSTPTVTPLVTNTPIPTPTRRPCNNGGTPGVPPCPRCG